MITSVKFTGLRSTAVTAKRLIVARALCPNIPRCIGDGSSHRCAPPDDDVSIHDYISGDLEFSLPPNVYNDMPTSRRWGSTMPLGGSAAR